MLERLRDETGESVLLAVADPPRVVTLDVVESRQLVRAAPTSGMVLPPVGQRGGPGPARPPPPRRRSAPTSATRPTGALLDELAAVRRRGWALNQGACTPSRRASPPPCSTPTGRAVAAISVSAPTQRLPEARHAEVAALVVAAAASLSAG